MSTQVDRRNLSHVERTVDEPRDSDLHSVILKRVEQFNSQIRLIRFSPSPHKKSFTFLAGQWLDIHVPGIYKAGGFTITSPPSLLSSSNPSPYFELAIQNSPNNPAAAWLWKPEKEIIDKELQVRVGGSFVWPPKFYGDRLERVVFVAGGVGLNPLMSILSHLSKKHLNQPLPFDIQLLYTLRDPGEERSGDTVLFLERLVKCFNLLEKEDSLKLFLTGGLEESGVLDCNENKVGYKGRRIQTRDLTEALGPIEKRKNAVIYICGVPNMTDDFVKTTKETEGVDGRHVLCEKWW